MISKKYSILAIILMQSFFSLQSMRLRFIVTNNTNNNLYACLATHDCNPMLQAVMPPNTSGNIYTESFSSKLDTFIFNIKTNNQTTNYTVFYNSRSKIIQLKRQNIVCDEIIYNAEKSMYPIVIVINEKLDAYFNMDLLINHDTQTGMNTPNKRGYKPSTYLGNRGDIYIRQDKNRFCSRKSSCRNDISWLASYVGICDYKERGDNLNPFCKKCCCRK